jgi:plasmid stabilization system protein ParE
MIRTLIVRHEAETDLAEGRDWYESQREGLGLEFLTAVEKAFARIRDTPELHAVEFRGVRRTGTERFPYVVYYRLLVESVEVLAVLHGSRSPRHWRSRT